LPTDHISTGLLLLSYLHAANAEDFLAACLSPAIENLVRAMKGRNNPFDKLLTVVVPALDPGGDMYVVEPE
jgi:TorA maturation chaperone TorD